MGVITDTSYRTLGDTAPMPGRTATNYRSQEIHLAAFLLATGTKLSGHEVGQNLVTFIFTRDDTLDDKVQSYYNNEPVPVSSYVQALTTLRQIIRSRPERRTEQRGMA